MSKITDKLRGNREDDGGDERLTLKAMDRRIKALESEVQECRQVNRRLADLVDVVAELLVPALDRDDARVAQALTRLGPGS